MPLGPSCFLSVEIFKIPPKKALFSLLFQRFLRFPSQPSSLSVLSQMRSHPFRLIEVVLGGTRWYFIKLSPLNIGCNWRQTKIRLHKKNKFYFHQLLSSHNFLYVPRLENGGGEARAIFWAQYSFSLLFLCNVVENLFLLRFDQLDFLLLLFLRIAHE